VWCSEVNLKITKSWYCERGVIGVPYFTEETVYYTVYGLKIKE
jgi:hypothetical protein